MFGMVYLWIFSKSSNIIKPRINMNKVSIDQIENDFLAELSLGHPVIDKSLVPHKLTVPCPSSSLIPCHTPAAQGS